MDWMLMPLKRYADFSGRSCRQEYWMFQLFILLVVIVMGILFGLLAGFGNVTDGGGGSTISTILVVAFALIFVGLFLVPGLAVTIRRFHDQDKSGWFVLLNFIPYVGGIVLIVFMCLKGTDGPNRFGDDPLNPQKLGDIFS